MFAKVSASDRVPGLIKVLNASIGRVSDAQTTHNLGSLGAFTAGMRLRFS
jgi:hypothetical protein